MVATGVPQTLWRDLLARALLPIADVVSSICFAVPPVAFVLPPVIVLPLAIVVPPVAVLPVTVTMSLHRAARRRHCAACRPADHCFVDVLSHHCLSWCIFSPTICRKQWLICVTFTKKWTRACDYLCCSAVISCSLGKKPNVTIYTY